VLAGENPGSKLDRAESLGVPVIGEEEFEDLYDDGGEESLFGDIVEDSSSDLGTIHTGDQETVSELGVTLEEGEALVLIENDNQGVDLNRTDVVDNSGELEPPSNETGIFAQLTQDSTAIDFTEKNFVGVLTFESGSISGIISNDDVLLPDTFVWTADFRVEDTGTQFLIQPNFGASPTSGLDDIQDSDDVNNTVFDITVRDSAAPSANVIEQTQATGEELRSYDLAANISVVSESSETEFNLLRTAADHQNGDYSMDRVPSQEVTTATGNDLGVDYRRLTAAQYETGSTGNGSTAEAVRTGFTVEGNVVITEAQPIDDGNGASDISDYTDANGDTTTSLLQTAIDDWRNDDIDTGTLQSVIDNWRQSG